MCRIALPTIALLFAVFAGLSVSSPADARGGRHHHHGHGHSHFGVFFGFPGPFYYPAPVYYPYPRYYETQPVYLPPPQYIEQNPPAQPAPPTSGAPTQGAGSGHYWYYCPDSRTYYPYVQTCGTQWQQVVPGSAPPS
jgi:hypothetical protein